MNHKLFAWMWVFAGLTISAWGQSNLTPSFSRGSNIVVNLNSGAQSFSGWTRTFSAGSMSEDGSQAVSFEIVSNDNPFLFKVQPSISVQTSPIKNATLSFTPAANAEGTANLKIRIKDDGGTPANSADDAASATQSVAVTILRATSVFNESPAITRSFQYQSAPGLGVDVFTASARDAAGNVYLTGYSKNSSGNHTDMVTVKINGQTGQAIWTSRFNGSSGGNDAAVGIVLDPFGNAFVAGTSASAANGDDVLVLKYDGEDGTQLWRVRYNGTSSSNDSATGIAIDSQANVYVAGVTIGVGTSDDYLILKYDTNGSQQWESLFSGTSTDKTSAIHVDSNANVYVTGTSRAGIGGDDILTLKLNSSGVPLWTNRFDGPARQNDRSAALATDSSGNVYVAGMATGSSTREDLAVLKLSPNTGTLLWSQTYDGGAGGRDEARAIAVDASGNLYVAGVSEGLNTSEDMVTIKYLANGTQDWVRRVNGDISADDEAFAIALDSAGEVYVAGAVSSFLTYDDAVVVKYSASGTLLWSRSFDAGGDEVAFTLTIDPFGRVVTGGYTENETSYRDALAALHLFSEEMPVGHSDEFSPLEDQVFSSPALGVLANDVDPDGRTLKAVLVGNGTTNGTLTLNANGTFTYSPASHSNGEDRFVYVPTDGVGHYGTATTVLLNVVPVNDPPSFTKGSNETVNEDSTASGPRIVNGWATSISAGPANESTQTLSFLITTDNDALFESAPEISSNGNLSYKLTPNAFGSATVSVRLKDNGGTENGGQDTSPAQTFTITVNAVNDSPSFTKGSNQTLLEDAGAQTVTGWATEISPGPSNESAQTVTFVVTNNNNALFSAQPAISPEGTLTFTTAPNANGLATVTVKVRDSGGTTNGGQNESADQTFTISVTPVNDAPAFTKGSNQTVLEDAAGEQSVNNWASSFNFGASDESTQTVVEFLVTNDKNDLFSVQPAISPAGKLTYTLAANSNGVATVSVQMRDSGGTENGGVDLSTVQTFTITVTSVNDAPYFTPGPNVTIDEDAGPQTIEWTTPFAGPEDEQAVQTLTFIVTHTNAGLFSGAPAISPAGVLTFAPNSNSNGTSTVTVRLRDNGGTANSGINESAAVNFTITVTSINDAPLASPDAIQSTRNEVLRIPVSKLLANDTDVEGGTLSITAVSSSSQHGGSVALMGDSVIHYQPPTNHTGEDTFTYTLSDGTDTASGTVTVTLPSMRRGLPEPSQTLRFDLSSAADFIRAMVMDSGGNLYAAGSTRSTANGYDYLVLKYSSTGTLAWSRTFNGMANRDDFATAIAVDSSGNVYVTGHSTRGSLQSDYDYMTVKYDASGTQLWTRSFNGAANGDDQAVAIALSGTDAYVTGFSTGSTTGKDFVTVRLRGSDGNQTWLHTFNGAANQDDEARAISIDSAGNILVTGYSTASTTGRDYLTLKLRNDGVKLWEARTSSLGVQSDIPEAVGSDSFGDVLVAGASYGGLATREDYLVVKYKASDGSVVWEKRYNGPANNVDAARAMVIDRNDYIFVTGTSRGVGSSDDIATLKLDFDGNGVWTNRFNGSGNGSDKGYALFLDGRGDAFVAGESFRTATSIDYVLLKYSVDGASKWETYYAGPVASGNDIPVAVAGLDGRIYIAGSSPGATTDSDGAIIGFDHISRPRVTDDSFTAVEDTTLTASAPGVLGNDTPIDEEPLTAELVTQASNGTVTLRADGSFDYVPNSNFFGSDSFTYRAKDLETNSLPATVTLTVTGVNDAPTAVSDAFSTMEDTDLVVAPPGVLSNDTDPENQILSAVLVSSPENGTLTLNANGSFSYRPHANFAGGDTFSYKVTDGGLESSPVNVSITVAPVNDAPLGAADSYSTPEDVMLTIATPGVLSNDVDVEGSPLTAELVSGPSQGSLTLNANGSFSYTPSANYHGQDSFVYRASDGQAFSANTTVAITVTPVNDPPVGVADSYTLSEDTLFEVTSPGVLQNDENVDGDTLVAVLVSGTTKGTLTFNENGSFSYLPETNYFGTDSFVYKANDGTVDSGNVTVTLTIQAVNDAPAGSPESYTLLEDTPLEVQAPGVLTNDSDVEEDPLTVELVSPAAHGTVALSENGSFLYTPEENYFGSDTFQYRVSDGNSFSSPVTVELTIAPVNDLPVVVSDNYSGTEDTLLTVAAPGVLSNDSDVEEESLSAILVQPPAHGTLEFNSSGGFEYRPNTNYFGADSFTYKASDGSGESVSVVVALNIAGVNDAPREANDSYTTSEDVALEVAAPGVLANDTDVDGDALSAALVSAPDHGVLIFNQDGSFIYTPNENYHGLDSFTYLVSDGTEQSTVAAVTLNITSVNDAPTGTPDSYSGLEDQQIQVIAPGVLSNDTDVEGSSLNAILVGNATHGTVQLQLDGSFVYTPTANYNGEDGFSYKISDGETESAVVAVSLTVGAINDPPAFTKGPNQTINEDSTSQSINNWATNISTGPADEEPQTLTFVVNNDNPSLFSIQPSINSTGKLVYRPASDKHGTAVLTVVLKDNGGTANGGNDSSAPQTFTITVVSVNDSPALVTPISDITVQENSSDNIVSLEGVFWDNDIATDGDSLTWSVASNSNASLVTPTVEGTSLRLSYGRGQSGTATLVIRATDQHGAFAEDTFIVTVEEVVDPIIDEISFDGTNFTLTWTSTPGSVYRVQYKDDLNALEWTDLPGDVTSSENVSTKVDSTATGVMRFYRVMVVE